MAYVPQGFQSGDVLMASQLNEMDSQIARNELAATKRDFIANNYDPTATYQKGDLAIYNGTVQVATVNIQTPESFTPSHWKLTTINSELQGKRTEIENMSRSVSDLEDAVSDIEDNISSLGSPVSDVESVASGIMVSYADGSTKDIPIESGGLDFDGGYVDEENLFHLTIGGVDLEGFTPFQLPAGGGGGGGAGGTAAMSITNGMPWLATTIREGNACALTFSWASTIDDVPTGVGTLKVTVNNTMRAALNAQQGSVTVDVGEYLSSGTNTVRLSVTDVYGNVRTLVYTITTVSISVRSAFEYGTIRNKRFTFPYTPVGSGEKTVHIKLDGVEQETITTSVSGRQLTYPVPAQSYGAHSIELWLVAQIGSETVESNHLYYEYVYSADESGDPVITSNFHQATLTQYSTVSIPYTVYDPDTPQCEVKIYEDTELKATLTVGREEQVYTYRAVNSGEQTIWFKTGSVMKTITFTVTAVDIDVDAESEGLELYLSSQGRSNQEANPATWISDNVAATFTGFNWTSDGWQRDADGVTVLRIDGGASVQIPYQIFAEDFRASGRTVEIEFATHNVRNYDTPVISCLSGGRGLQINSQNASFASEQSSISAQFKDDEHVRLSFVVEKRSEQRLVMIYIDGVVSGVVRYPDNDDFAQMTPVDITLGGNDATLDIYAIRVYDHDLTRFQILSNWIADTQDGVQLTRRFEHNDIFDAYGNIVIGQLPNDLPYMVLTGDLPTYKGNKLPIEGEYVDPVDPSNSFNFTGTIDVQGTSSQYYARKNYKIKFSEIVQGGQIKSKYTMNSDAIPVNTFTFKADVASSEGANNVELARLYNEICPYKTPYQKADAKVRQGIDGFPIVIFHNSGNTTVFLGKYNFNNDKGTEAVFGFSDGDESWEILNNTSNRVLWKSADYTGDDWTNDFEARYPEDNTNTANLKALAEWLVSTDQGQATGNALSSSVTYTDGEGQDAVTTTYTHDTAAYRLAKFKHEIEDHMELDSILFYYLFTELFLMVDSRAKNAFPSMMGGDKWCILPYDFDTALGINNEGSLTFSYNLEDTDTTPGGADIYNGQDSVLWVNLRQAFQSELRAMYQSLRSNGKISFEKVEQMFETHQDKWPEAIFNEDAQYKYLDPLINDNDASYLGMLQGSKEAQRKWWLYNRFRYIDSKYNAGDALTDYIQLRGYAKADITVRPYADIYPAVKYGSYLVTRRGARNVDMTLANPLDNVNDTEIYIYSCSQLSSIGDISGLKVGFADFSRATKLQTLKIGDSSSGYTNGNLTELYLGNNTLLQSIDVRNCTALAQAVDLSGCTALENVYFDGTAVSGVSLPNGGTVKVLHLPGTISNLTLLNQTKITDFTCPNFSNITTLRLENAPAAVDAFEILDEIAEGSRVRLYNFHWELSDLDDLADLYDKLDDMRGLDQNGNTTPTAQIYGTVHVATATGAEMARLGNRYPDVTVTYDNLTSNLYYYDFYGTTLLHTESITNGGNGTWNDTPSKPSDTAQYTFGSFDGWATTPESNEGDVYSRRNVTADRNVYAAFGYTVRTYTATFKLASADGGTTLYTQTNVPYGTTPVYGGTTPVSTQGEDFVFDNKWSPELGPITGNTTYNAVFKDTASPVVKYLKGTMTEYDNDADTVIAPYTFISNNVLTAVRTSATTIESNNFTNMANLEIIDLTASGAVSINISNFGNGLSKLTALIIRSNSVATVSSLKLTTMVSGNGVIYVPAGLVTSYKAADKWSTYSNRIFSIDQYPVTDFSTVSDSWDAIISYANAGTIGSHYAVGDTKKVTIDGVDYYAQLAGINKDTLSSDGTTKANSTWLLKTMLSDSSGAINGQGMNASNTTAGGWADTVMRNTTLPAILQTFPANLQSAIKSVNKVSYRFEDTSEQTTADKLWIPSSQEVNLTGSYLKETTGVTYDGVFTNDASRVRTCNNGGDNGWWLRSAFSDQDFVYVHRYGSGNNNRAVTGNGMVLGFCI